MRAIKIDPVSRTVTEINLTQNPNETLQELYDIIGCDLVQPVQLDRGIVMVVDEDGKCKDIKGGFTFIGWGAVIAGTGIILGGSAHKFKSLQENLASFQMLTEWNESLFFLRGAQMNIFVLDENPQTAAEMLCDCHLRRMCVETAQILSGVMLRRGMSLLDGMPRPQNTNHPVIVAAASAEEATNWTCFYFYSILREFHIRFGKHHKYFAIFPLYFDNLVGSDLSDSHSKLAICVGDLDVSELDIVSAYRKYYTEVKKPALQAKGLWQFTNRKDWTE